MITSNHQQKSMNGGIVGNLKSLTCCEYVAMIRLNSEKHFLIIIFACSAELNVIRPNTHWEYNHSLHLLKNKRVDRHLNTNFI